MKQAQLNIIPPAPPPISAPLSPDASRLEFDKLLAQIRAENQLFQDRARKLGVATADQPIIKWAIADIKAVRESLEADNLISVAIRCDRSHPSPKPIRLYRPHSLESRQRRRCTLILSRAQKLYSFPDLWIDWVQSQLADKPWYFGVCQINGTQCSCPDYAGELKRAQAIARENEIR